MCHRITPLLFDELQQALDELHVTGHARMPQRDPAIVVPDAYPGTQMPLFVVGDGGELEVRTLSWGFDAPPTARTKLVFNTRIETALPQMRAGRGMWANALAQGRCLVPARSFYESWTREPPRRGAQVRFRLPGRQVFLLAGICERDRFSVVTTEPNADVAPMHSRMPLVLGPGESSVWLGPQFAQLADRSGIRLSSEPELPEEKQASLL